ncbi:restriction endonuclease subunit S [Tolypothrix sp. FACHB-123]|uniref:restriction endonuclease subunit S n=1 Tax=Tolypothrix sp. FACHB-123 TaxID=2692868 RepID=UPI001681F692|nr:restriction endonuclease subunit S [Tolypothrix sp. FACHB-123]MBD2357031.1 restriction endonuclease subunit S [Tolypothrix sp. FACHB-123]
MVGISDELTGLPEGWVWTIIGEVAECLDYKRVPISKDERAKRIGDIPYYGANGLVGWIDDHLFDEPLVLVVEDETFVGREKPFSYKIEGKTWVNNHAHVLRPTNVIDVNFLNYSLQYYPFTPLTTGTTGRRKLTQKSLLSAPYILPPLHEQKRIVAKIEELNDRTQRAKEALEAIPQLCDRFRQSVLAAAFRGDLTADWREQNPDVEPASDFLEKIHNKKSQSFTTEFQRELPETWIWAKFADVAEIKSNLVSPSDYLEFPHIAPNHIVSNTGELLEFTTIKEDKVTSPKHLFEPGQILYSKIRPYLAKAVLVNFVGLCSADMYPISTFINTAFLHQWMICPEFTEIASSQQGRTVLPKINQAALNQLVVPLPPIEEQKQIVYLIQKYLTAIDCIRRQYQNTKSKLETLNQSILAKAFRGELLPQDPDDEPASVLLKRIRAEREKLNNSKPKSKRTSNRKSKTPEGQVSIPGLE